MEPNGTAGAGGRASGALAAALLTCALALGAPDTARAGLSDGCRVPESYLAMPPALDRTESRVLGRRDVRVVVLGPLFGRPLGSISPLEEALERRLPGTDFKVLHALSPGLAEDDFAQLRSLISRQPADLVIWQVGVRDAMAASDVEDFEATLDQAHDWIEKRGADLVLIDPPFVAGVGHERIYVPYVGEIGEISREEGVPVLRRYAAMQYLDAQANRNRAAAATRPRCIPELMAEAIMRAVGR